MKDILKLARAGEDGKPVPFTIDFRDGSAPATIMMPLKKKALSGRPGAPRKLTLAQLVDHIRRHPSDFSDAARARMLSAEMGTTISRTVVLKLRHQLERRREGRRKSSGAK